MPPKRKAAANDTEMESTPSRRSGRVRTQASRASTTEPVSKRARKTPYTKEKTVKSASKTTNTKAKTKDEQGDASDKPDNMDTGSAPASATKTKGVDHMETDNEVDTEVSEDTKDTKASETKSDTPASSLWANWGKKTDTWTCVSCGVMNDNKLEECAACTTSKNAKATPKDPPAAVAEPKLPAPAVDSTAPGASLWANWGKKEGAWTCPSCAVNNIDKSKDTCPACDTKNPASTSATTGASTTQAPASTFSFGVAPGSTTSTAAQPISFGVPASANTASTAAAPVTFGIPSTGNETKVAAPVSFGIAPSTTTEKADETGAEKPAFKFGIAPKSE